MSLSSKTELARALFRSTPPDSVTRISGTATADSSDGTVTVQLEDGDVIEVGTIGSVSAGDTVTIHVQRGEAQVIASEGWGDAMQAAVDEATAIAEATGQHFWHDSNGAHVTEITQEQWAQSQTGHNILVNSYGMLLRDALNFLAAFSPSAVVFYDGQGNDASNITASFGADGVSLGESGQVTISPLAGSRTINERESIGDFPVPSDIDLSVASVFAELADGSTFYVRLDVTGGSNTFLFTKGEEFSDMIYQWHADYDGDSTVSIWIEGTYSGTVAASVIGVTVKRGGILSLGKRSGQNGMFSTSLGEGLIASGDDQTVMGTYNVEDSGKALIIGNGSWNSASEDADRSNALTVDWSGNVEAAGDVRAGGSTPLVPIGTILDFAAATAPTGYLVCDGSAVSRTTYAALFAVIGTTWGSGNGSTTFNVPDFRGRTAIGAGTGTASDATAHALGSNGGTETHKLTSAQSGVPAHNHPLPNSAIVYNADGTQRLATSGSGTKSSVNTSVGLSTASNTAADASSAHPNMQPYAAVTKIIRAI